MTVRVTFTRPGKGTSEFSERLVVDQPSMKVLLLEGYPSEPVYQNDALILGRNAPIIWFVFPGLWYEIGRFHTTDGQFTGWYTNLCTPFVMDGKDWSTTDLFLDFWQPVAGGGTWLDEDELEAAVASGLLDHTTQHQIQLEKDAISHAYQREEWPPPITRNLDLPTAQHPHKPPTTDIEC